ADGLAQDNRTDAEKRVAEVEAEIKLIELEQQLADLKEEKEDNGA
ncbi:glycine zipper family protein, partial [Vibrio sp. 10N.261.48.A2]